MKRHKKAVLILLALVLVAGLGLALFHQHAQADHEIDCLVCHFVRSVASALMLVAAFILLKLLQTSCALVSVSQKLKLLFFSSAFQNRAPPAFS